MYLSHHKTVLDEHRLLDRYSVGEAPWLRSDRGTLATKRQGGGGVEGKAEDLLAVTVTVTGT